LVGIVYEAKKETGGILVCCEHGVISHDGSKGNYWVPYDKYKIVSQRDATIPIPPELQAIRGMVMARELYALLTPMPFCLPNNLDDVDF
jgi:hypothetical protein